MLGSYMQLPWALLLQYFVFHETMDLLSTLGACIIMGSTIWVVVTKEKEKAVVEESIESSRNVSLDSSNVPIQSMWTRLMLRFKAIFGSRTRSS